MLTVLGWLAEFERELIRARTGEGRKRAKERGVRFGRPRKMTPHQRQEALQRLAAGETQADVARSYNVDATTIGRLRSSGQWPSSKANLASCFERHFRGAIAHAFPSRSPTDLDVRRADPDSWFPSTGA